MTRFRIAALTTALGIMALAGTFAVKPALALDGTNLQFAQADADDASADEPVRPVRRARTQIEVRPLRPMHRECSFRLVQEFRPSGTVIVPRETCWWVR